MIRSRLPLNLALATATLLSAACGTAPEAGTAAAKPVADTSCVPTLGSNICRRSGQSGPTQVQSISAEELRRGGGDLIGPVGERIR